MSHFKFLVLPKDELLQVQAQGVYRVRDYPTVADIASGLQNAEIGFESDGPDYILDNFDTYFGILMHGIKIETHLINKAYKLIVKSFKQFVQNLKLILSEDDQLDNELSIRSCNILQMTSYIICGLLLLYNTIHNKNEDDLLQKKKKGRKLDDDSDWQSKKNDILVVFYNCISLPIQKLWDPPIVDQEFVKLIANACYKCLEDSSIKHVKHLRDTIFQIIGILTKEHNHGFDCTTRLVDLIQSHEHTPTVVSAGVEMLVNEFNCKSLINRLITNILDWMTSSTVGSTELKQCSIFLVELAKRLPEKMTSEIYFLGEQLDSDSHQFRMTVLSIMAEVVVHHSGEGLNDDAKEQRDYLLECLDDHLHDSNAFVRVKILQLWARLQEDQAVPVNRQPLILNKIIGRLNDKSTNVRKAAIATVKTFLEYNPCSSMMNIEEIEKKLSTEKSKLEELRKNVNGVNSTDQRKLHWVIIHQDLYKVIERKINEERNSELPLVSTQTRMPLEEAFTKVEELILKGDYEGVFEFAYVAEGQNDPSIRKQRQEMDVESQVGLILDLIRHLYVEKNAFLGNNIQPTAELSDQFIEQEKIVEFLEASFEYANALTKATDKIRILLKSKTLAECKEAIDYFKTANRFLVQDNMNGVLDMLSLVYLKEEDRKLAIIEPLQDILFTSTAKSDRGHSLHVVKNLIKLAQSIERSHYYALKTILVEWTSKGIITNDQIQVMWELFTRKLPETSETDSRAALMLLEIIAGGKPEIVSVNLNILNSILKTNGLDDFRVVKSITEMFLKLGSIYAAKGEKSATKFTNNDEILTIYSNILITGWNYNDEDYVSMSLKIVEFFYELCDHPDLICSKLLKQFHQDMFKKDDNNIATNIPAYKLVQFLSFLGHVVINHLVFLDVTVYKELKRRNRIRDAKKPQIGKKNSKKKVVNESKKKMLIDDSTSSVTSASLSRKQQMQDEEQLAVEGAVADDADAEYIFDVIENKLLTKESLLGNFVEIPLKLCQQSLLPNDIPDEVIVIAVQSFTKFLTISSVFTQENLSLLFTILEKNKNEIIRCNIIISLSDLIKRFPNLLEPWTPYIYKRLRDDSLEVRRTTMIILSHLIQHDLIRVKGQISEMALCICDGNKLIQSSAKTFFRQLSQKGNALYNVMPDIISKLSDPSAKLTEDQFKDILKYLLNLVQKDKHTESLVIKLIARLRIAVHPRQCCDLAYCLSIINFNFKGLRYLMDNILTIRDKLQQYSDIYNSFKHIHNAILKSTKPEIKELSKELLEKIENCVKNEGENNENAIINNENNSVLKQTRSVKKLKTKGKSKKKRNQQSSSNESDSDSSVASKTRKQRSIHVAKSNKNNDDSDDSINNFDIEADDSGVTPLRKSLRRSYRKK